MEIIFPQIEIPPKMFCSTLKYLVFDPVDILSEQKTKLILGAFPNVERLAFRNSQVKPKDISKCFQKLKRLDIRRFNDNDFAGVKFPSLLQLTLYENGEFQQIFNSCPNLKRIVVRRGTSERTFEAILKNAKSLKSLIILHGSELPQNTIEWNEHLLKHLEELRIYCYKQKVEASTLLAKHLKLRSYVTSENGPWLKYMNTNL